MRASLAEAVVAMALLAAAGCGYLAAGVAGVAALAGERGGGPGAAAPDPPSIQIAPSMDRASLFDGAGARSATEIKVDYRISDPTSADLSLDVKWRLESEGESALGKATEASGAGSDGTSRLRSSPDPGTAHVFVWAAGADLAAAGLVEERVVLRMTPSRPGATGATGASGAAKEATLLAGNRAPAVSIDAASGDQTRNVGTTFEVLDSASDETTVTLTAQALDESGQPFGRAATVRNRLIAAGSDTVVQPLPGGVREGILWDSTDADGDGTADDFGFRNLTVRLTLAARDRFGLEASATADVTLANDNPPAAQILAVGFPGKPLRGRVPVTYAVLDVEAKLDPSGSGKADIAVELSRDGGRTFATATAIVIGEGSRDFSTVTSGRPVGALGEAGAVAAGTSVFLWDTAADVGATPEGGTEVRLRVTPRSSLAGVAAETRALFVENPLEFDAAPVAGTRNSPRAIAVADFTGDEIPDLAVANYSSDTVSIFHGRGDGQFDPAELPATAAKPRALAAADFTGDGRPDLVVACEGGQVTLLRNVSLAFTRADTPIPTPRGVAAGDFDGDGILDVAVTSEASGAGSVRILTGDPNQNLNPSGQVPVGARPFGIVAADLTGDRILDLAVANNGANTLSILQGGGAGGFTVIATPAVGKAPRFVVAADFTGDGIIDLATANDEVFDVLREVPPACSVSVLVGSGGGQFAPARTIAIGQPTLGIAALDMTGDGITDLCVTTGGFRRATVLRGRGDGTFEQVASLSTVTTPRAIIAADLSGDGIPDMAAVQSPDLDPPVTGSSLGTVAVFLGRGEAQFDLVASSALGNVPRDLIAADVTGDGIPDLAATTASEVVELLAGRGDGQFDLVARVPGASVSVGQLAAADFTGDALADLAVIDTGATDLNAQKVGTVSIFEGGAAFGLTATAQVNHPWYLAAADFTMDGIADLAVTNPGFGTVSLLRGLGGGRFANGSSVGTVGQFPFGVAALDLSLDGVPDLAVANHHGDGANTVSIFLGRRDGGFDSAGSTAADANPQEAAGLDLTCDGIPDLAVANQGAALVTAHRGRGDGTFSIVARLGTAAGPAGMAALDLTGDGVLDLAAAANTITVLRGRPRGRPEVGRPGRGERGWGASFNRRGTTFGSQGLHTVATLDATPDGVPDLAITDEAAAVNVFSVSHVRASRPLPLGGQAPPAGVAESELRVVNVAPLDPMLGEPGRVATPTAGTRLSPASLASTACPDTATFAADFTVTLPLFSHLTGRELDGAAGVIRVYRHERDVQGARGLPGRLSLVGRIVEVASTAPEAARDLDGDGTADVALATVSATAGTISFPVRRFGTFQSFIEVPKATVPLLRETFDDMAAPDGALAPLPEGWTAGFSWQVGPPPTFTASPAGPDAPASTPNVLGTNLRGTGYRANASDAVTTATIVLGAAPGTGRRIALRYREWVRLGAGDSLSVEVIPAGGSPVAVPNAGHVGAFSSDPGEGFVDAGPFDVTALVGSATAFRLRFRIDSDGAGGGRGWYVDDLDVAIESN